MKHLSAVSTALLCALAFVPPAPAMTPVHRHGAGVMAAPVPTSRWAPDASLREGIRKVHAAVDELHHYELGHMSASMAIDRAVTIEQAVTYMFAHCKLAAGPDATLHGILVPLLAGAQALQSDPQNLKAIADMRAAIASYPQYFDDPGWDQAAPDMHEMRDEP